MDWSLIFQISGQGLVRSEACYYALAAIGLNIQFGYTGLLNFGQVVFAAAGAYGLAVSVTTYGLSFWAGLSIGMFAAIVIALVLGFPTLRLRADYLAIVTIAAGEIVRLVVRSVKYTDIFGGTDGLNNFANRFYEVNPLGVGTYGFWIFKFNERETWLLLCGWTLVAICSVITFLLVRSPWGRVIKAIREDEDAVRSLGKNTYWYKIQSLTLGGIFGALSGFVFAVGQQSINPDNYSTLFTFTALTALVLGGRARVLGPIIGAILFNGFLAFADVFLRQAIGAGYIPDWLIDNNKVGAVRFMLVGIALMALMIFRPQGIFGDKREVAIADR